MVSRSTFSSLHTTRLRDVVGRKGATNGLEELVRCKMSQVRVEQKQSE